MIPLLLALTLNPIAHAKEPVHISASLLSYLTDSYLEERVPDYKNPMERHHDLAGERSRVIAIEIEKVPTEERDSLHTKLAFQAQREGALSLEESLTKVFWPAQRELMARIKSALNQDVEMGPTDFEYWQLGDDLELMFLFAEARKSLDHDLEVRANWKMGTPRPEFYGANDYAEGWHRELERFRAGRCLEVLR